MAVEIDDGDAREEGALVGRRLAAADHLAVKRKEFTYLCLSRLCGAVAKVIDGLHLIRDCCCCCCCCCCGGGGSGGGGCSSWGCCFCLCLCFLGGDIGGGIGGWSDYTIRYFL